MDFDRNMFSSKIKRGGLGYITSYYNITGYYYKYLSLHSNIPVDPKNK